jgi:hypothetical protein
MSGRIPSTSSSSGLNTSISNMMNSSGLNASGIGLSGAHPLQIIDITKDHKFKLNEENLLSILNHPKARMKKVNTSFSIFILF